MPGSTYKLCDNWFDQAIVSFLLPPSLYEEDICSIVLHSARLSLASEAHFDSIRVSPNPTDTTKKGHSFLQSVVTVSVTSYTLESDGTDLLLLLPTT